jgi:hypothetical protein
MEFHLTYHGGSNKEGLGEQQRAEGLDVICKDRMTMVELENTHVNLEPDF